MIQWSYRVAEDGAAAQRAGQGAVQGAVQGAAQGAAQGAHVAQVAQQGAQGEAAAQGVQDGGAQPRGREYNIYQGRRVPTVPTGGGEGGGGQREQLGNAAIAFCPRVRRRTPKIISLLEYKSI